MIHESTSGKIYIKIQKYTEKLSQIGKRFKNSPEKSHIVHNASGPSFILFSRIHLWTFPVAVRGRGLFVK